MLTGVGLINFGFDGSLFVRCPTVTRTPMESQIDNTTPSVILMDFIPFIIQTPTKV